MATIISSTNNKWGVGKTSTIVNIAQILAYQHKNKVLVIDLDQQCNLSRAILGKRDYWVNENAGELFDINSKVDIRDIIVQKTNNLHIIPGKVNDVFLIDAIMAHSKDLIQGNVVPKLKDILEKGAQNISDLHEVITSLEWIVWEREEWIRVLKKRLSVIESDYDYIFLDLPPSVARVPENAWVASDFLLVPISDKFALDGTEGLIEKMVDIKRNYNDSLRFIFFFNKVPLSSNQHGKDLVNKDYQKIIDGFISAISANPTLAQISFVMEDVIRASKDIEKSYLSGKSLIEKKESEVLNDYRWFVKSLKEFIN